MKADQNQLNYGSLEACHRLHEAGIVIETEVVWSKEKTNEATGNAAWQLGFVQEETASIIPLRKGYYSSYLITSCDIIPAPSMAEVWRELPEGSHIHKWDTGNAIGVLFTVVSDEITNPTDALIDLLIWVGKEAL